MSEENDSKTAGIGGSFPLNEEMKLGEAGMKTINALNKKAALATMNMFKRALSTASEPLFRTGLGERYYTPESFHGALTLWLWGTVLSGYIAYSGSGTIAGWLLAHIHLFRLARFFDLWYFPAITGGAFILYYSQLCLTNGFFLRNCRNKDIPYHSMSRGELRWNKQTMPLFLAIIAGLILFDIFVFIALALAVLMAKKIASEQQAVIHSRYLDAIDQKLEDKYMKEALLGRAKQSQSYLARPLSERYYTPETREKVADAWVGGNVAVVARPRRSATPGNNPAQASTGGREGESSPMPAVGSASGEEKEEPDPAAQVQLFSIPKVDPKTIKRAAILAAGVFAIYIVCHLCSFMWREVHAYLARRPAANPTVAVSPAPKEPTAVVQSRPKQQPRVESQPLVGNPKTDNTPVESTVTQSTPRAIVATKPPIEPTTSPSTSQAAVEPNTPVVPTATQNTPQTALPESSQGKLAEAIKSLNVFSNYCYATLSTNNALIAKISDQGYHERLERISQAVEQSISKIIAHQQEYLEQLTPGPDADASIERSTAKLVANRSSETNNLVQLNLAIQQAMPKN